MDLFNATSFFETEESYLLSDFHNLSFISSNAASNESYEDTHPSSDKTFWALLLIPLPLVAVIGNILVILSVYKERSLQTVTNYFIVSLALADLLVAAVVMPFAVYVLVNGDWELSDTLCDFYIAVDVTCSTASIFNLVAISVDRYIAVTQPIKYSKHKNHKRVLFTILGCWLISAGIGSPIVLGLNTSPERTPELCIFYNSNFIILSSIGSFYIPCFIMIFLYWKIFKAIHKRAKKNKLRQTNSESAGASGSASLTNDPPATISKNPDKEDHLLPGRDLKIVVENDGITTNTGSGSQEDDDTFNEDSFCHPPPIKGASAMLLSAFMTETIRIEIPINGNTDSGYGTSHVEQETQLTSVIEQDSSKNEDESDISQSKLPHEPKKNGVLKSRKRIEDFGDPMKKCRFNLGRRHKSSRKKKEKASVKRERKATKTLAIVLGMFLICWVPFFSCNVYDAICIKLEITKWRPGMAVFLVTTWLGYINSCVNPVIYTIFNMEFRKAFKKLLIDYWWC